MDLIPPARRLVADLADLCFSAPVACVYRPLDYAWRAHESYLRRYGRGTKRILFLGMNPGPFGMTQTGVPFGEVNAVRDWLGICETIDKPLCQHPKRPIDGFECHRSEVSGRRLWGLFAERFGTAERFFGDHFVVNFCPLVWMSATGANITPERLPAEEMEPVEQACLAHLADVLSIIKPRFLIGVGGFAEDRLKRVASLTGSTARIGKILHPSPASPAANRGWAEAASRQLADLGVW